MNSIYKNKFVMYSFCENQWLWFHIFACALGTKLFLLYFTKLITFSLVFAITIIWEVIEFKLEIYTSNNVCNKHINWLRTPYRSKQRWVYDTIGDVVGALIICLIVII